MTKKILSLIAFVASVAACTDDYKDWSAPQKVSQPEIVSFADGSVATVGVIDFNSVTDERVKVCTITPPTASKEGFDASYTLAIGDQVFDIAGDGTMSADDLHNYIKSVYGRRPDERSLDATVSMWLGNGTTTVKTATSAVFQIKAIPQAPQISNNYYIVGGASGDWAGTATAKSLKFSHSGKDVYEDPVFSIVIDAADGDTWFAIGDDEACDAIANDNDWSKLFGTTKGNGSTDLDGALDRRYNLSDDGSFCVPAGSKLIKVTIDMMSYTYKIEPVNISDKYYLIGGPGNWDNSKDQLFSHSTQSVIDDPVFTYIFPGTGGDMWFAFGDEEAIDAVGEGTWNKLFGTTGASEDLSGSFDRRYNLDGDHSFHVDGQAKFYRFQVNMAEMTYTITPLNFAEYFYEIGNESGWSTAHPLYGPAGDGKYQGFYYLNGEFKYKPNEGDWNDDLEYVSGDTMSGTLTDGGGPNCPDPGAGFYRIDLDAASLTYTLKKIDFVSIIGTANGNWDTDTDLTYNEAEGCWEVTCDLNAGEMKFRGNHNWDGDVDLGGSFDNLVHGGSNIAVEAGNYTIKLYISIAGQHHAVVTKN